MHRPQTVTLLRVSADWTPAHVTPLESHQHWDLASTTGSSLRACANSPGPKREEERLGEWEQGFELIGRRDELRKHVSLLGDCHCLIDPGTSPDGVLDDS